MDVGFVLRDGAVGDRCVALGPPAEDSAADLGRVRGTVLCSPPVVVLPGPNGKSRLNTATLLRPSAYKTPRRPRSRVTTVRGVMKMRTCAQIRLIALAAGILALACSPLGANQETQNAKAPAGRAAKESSRSRAEQVPMATDMVRLHLEIVELRLTADQLNDIHSTGEKVDVEALAADASKHGQVAVKYVFDSPVVVGRQARLLAGTRALIRTTSRSDGGESRAKITYEDVGCVVEVASSWVDAEKKDRIAASWNVEISAVIFDTPIEAGSGVGVPSFMEFSQRISTICDVGSQTSFSMLSSQMDTGQGGNAVAYVYRVRFDPIEEN